MGDVLVRNIHIQSDGDGLSCCRQVFDLFLDSSSKRGRLMHLLNLPFIQAVFFKFLDFNFKFCAWNHGMVCFAWNQKPKLVWVLQFLDQGYSVGQSCTATVDLKCPVGWAANPSRLEPGFAIH